MLRQALPGELWRINTYQAHCLLIALERFTDFFHEDLLLWFWIQQLAPEASAYDPGVEEHFEAAMLITPTDADLKFFERLIGKEMEHLGYHDSTYKMPCGHEAREHEICLSDWTDREIETAKKFASSREAVARLPVVNQIYGSSPYLSRADAERIIEEEVKRYTFRRKMRDAESLRQIEELNPPGYDRQHYIGALNRACQAGVEDARAQLREIMEKYIIKE